MASTAGVDEESQPLPPRRTPEWYHALGFKNPWGLHAATFYEKLTFGWGAPLLDKGSYGQITEEMADALPPPEDEAPLRAQQFADCYDHCQEGLASGKLWFLKSNLFARTVLLLHWRRMALHGFWTLLEVVVRLLSPLLLRQLLLWLEGNKAYGSSGGYPIGMGWLWAILLGTSGYLSTLTHHQAFWYGMHAGFMIRQQAISAIHAKVLRLNSASVAAVSVGQVVNLVSNDVRRFDDVGPYYMYLWAGPVEVVCVLVMVGSQLTFPASAAGVATLLLLIPFQGVLSKHIAMLRTNTAKYTDERVRLAGEAIAGSLAVKMLGWEDAMLKLLKGIRAQETSFAIRMARIRACNMALYFFITPLVSFIVFTVVHVQGKALDIASVFYTLALLHLPKLSMAQNFVHAVESGSELQVSVKRINDFLSLPEPPAPAHHAQHAPGSADKNPATPDEAIAVALGGADYDWNRWAGHPQPLPAHLSPSKPLKQRFKRQKKHSQQELEHQQEAGKGHIAKGETEEEDSVGHIQKGAAMGGDTLTLHGVQLQMAKGELLGICGEVGSGKSSLLAALLGELQPLEATLLPMQQPGSAPRGPVMKGTVAYCCQLPWVDAGSIRHNILFGKEYEEQWYVRVVTACALVDDLATLPWADLTEIGERGVNLSGGQKARLSLARAAYSRADIMLLDDPLSAVDPRVGRILFQECIGPQGIMQGSTRLLVTHQRHFLPHCDRILVLKDGCVRALGTHAQLAPSALTELTQLEEETELDDSVYDDQISSKAVPQGQQLVVDGAGAEAGSALKALNAGPVQATVDAKAPAAAAAASRITKAAGHLSTEQHTDGILTTSVLSDSLATLATAATATTAVDAADPASANATVAAPSGLQAKVSPLLPPTAAAGQNPESLVRQPEGQGHKGQAAFSPAHVVKKKYVLPPRVDHRWGPLRLCEKWVFRLMGYRKAHKPEDDGVAEEEEGKEQAQLNQQEGRATGSTSVGVYFEYFRYCGRAVMWVILAGLMVGQAVFVVSEYWLATWARQSYQEQREAKWIWVYGMLVAIVIVIAITRAVLFFHFTFKASSKMHDEVAQHVLRAPLSFFHTNPTGRILNRFSKDQGTADDHLPQVAFDATQSLFLVAGALILMIIAVPFVLPTLLPLVVAFFWLRHHYITTGREVKRFDATTRSPVYASFSAALKGLPTIRAYDVSDYFKGLFVAALDRNSSWWYAFLACSRWVGFRLDTLAAITLSFECILVMAVHERVSTRLVGLALAHVLNMSGMMQWAVRQTAETENDMTSVERMLEYTKLPQGGMSVGIVGRTGSGKSSLMLTLFRLIDQLAGRILIDGVDITTLGIDALRSQLAIIPQDPVLFSGSLRSNMDPEGAWPDHKLWEALAAVQLKEAVTKVGGLDAKMEEGGDNLSVGQRQLFCLARALLQDAQILALDEATANVDSTTDALIQQTLRDCTRGQLLGGRRRTLLVIAHRINTIMDSDMLLVLSDGKLVEQGSPAELSQKPGGTFARLVQAAQQSHS